MIEVVVLAASVVLQVVAALLALSLIRVTGRRVAWIAIAVAVLFMAVRRVSTLDDILSANGHPVPPLPVELIELLISILLLFGLLQVRPMFQRLQRSDELEAGFGQVVENSLNELYIFAADTLLFLRINRGARENLGYTAEELARLTPLDLKPDFEETHFRQRLDELDDTTPRIRFQTRHRRKDGSTYPVDVDLQQTMFESRQAFIAVIQDTTQKTEAERELRENEQHFRSLIEHSQDLTTVLCWDATVIYQSPSIVHILGHQPDDRIGQSALDLIHPDEVPMVSEALARARDGHVPEDPLVYRLRHADGNWRMLEGVGSVRELPDGTREFVINQRDITEREEARVEAQKTESMLQHAQRMELVGNLAGGIAHDFNNLLTPVMGYADLISADLDTNAGARKDLREILSAAKRAQELVHKLLVFSRRAEPKLGAAVFVEVVHEVMALVRVAAPSGIELRERYAAPEVEVFADATQLHQVVMNLCTNAIDAMGDTRGVLSVSLELAGPTAAADDQLDPVREGSFLRLSVADTGPGMAPETRDRIFEPFFTTKEVGKGTGLGLAVVHEIVQSHGGDIAVSSVLGSGTRFDVFLPTLGLHHADVGEGQSEARSIGTEHVLIVDDDKAVGEIVKRLLETQGYRATLLEVPAEAVAKVRGGEMFDLVVTDYDMPAMTGMEMAIELRAMQADLPIILMTGYAEATTPEKMEEAGIVAKLQKPFTRTDLAHCVRRTLDQNEP